MELLAKALQPLALGADRALDASIVLSFDRSGFRRHARSFDPADLAVDLTGRVCLVTGANSGIGRAAARALALRGATVRLLCRDEARGREAEAALRAETRNPAVTFERVDVASLASVRAFVERLTDPTVDVLVHNAGVLPGERIETADGLELTWATHVAGPFLLTGLLEERLRHSSDGRVVWVSSGGMYARALALDDCAWRRRRHYDGVVAYAETKRAQVVLSELWAARLAGSSVTVHAMHPGWADTPAVRSSLPRFWTFTRAILRDAEQGADTVVWLAAAATPRRTSGAFWLDRRPQSTHLLPGTRETTADRRRLWEQCTRWTALDLPAPVSPPAPGPTTVRLRHRVEVARADEEVFHYVADFSRLPDWDPGVASARRLDDQAAGVGRRFEVVARFLGRDVPLRYEVVAWDPPRRVVLEGAGAGVRVVDDVRLAPTGQGTAVEYVADVTPTGAGALATAWLRPLLERAGRRAIHGLERRLAAAGSLRKAAAA